MESIRFLTEEEMLLVAGGLEDDNEPEEMVVTGYSSSSSSSSSGGYSSNSQVTVCYLNGGTVQSYTCQTYYPSGASNHPDDKAFVQYKWPYDISTPIHSGASSSSSSKAF